MALYKMQISVHNLTAHKILKNKVDLILPKFQKKTHRNKEEFCNNNFRTFRFSFEGILSFLHHKRHKALQKAGKAMSITTDAQRNKLMHLENSLLMYRVYNMENLEKLVETV